MTMTKTATKLDPKTRIVLLVKENPRRAGTAAHKRAGIVMRAKLVGDALSRGAKTSTVRHLAESKVVRLVAPAKRTG